MIRYARSPLTAVLGPTNTGKTHLAVERMLAHSSGMMGFPLRLLAREVYDRVVAIKGENSVALITGEERIWPDNARYLMCTAEAMPLDAGERAFVALDEAQLGQDRERGHVFTSRILHARGREETMILGASTLTPVIRGLLPEAEIITRPRFSTLSYDGPKKLSRLPPRSVIVAFSAEEVYALAEALRRFSGGAAVVMGALSPRTRNAQVAMFQAGEVDYLVATDAIGMGLNLDVSHVAFAGLNKFDGVRQRRLTVAEMAQIAGRAGRHQRDGTFGSIGSEAAFTDEEVAAIEGHHFKWLDWLYWRNPAPTTDSVTALIADLEILPSEAPLRAAPEATDLAILKLLADDPEVTARATDSAAVARLWAACSLPDFTKIGAPGHARLVTRLWSDLSQGIGHLDADWFAQRLNALDVAEGSVEVLAERIAKVRTCCYIAQRQDWLADPEAGAEAARGVEMRLSDALHGALTARFVDRRTSILLRALGQGAATLPVVVDPADGAVRVDGETIGTLDGFAFRVDPAARASDQRMLLAAAERHLAVELAQRATALAGAEDTALSLDLDPARPPAILWEGRSVGTLARGTSRLAPKVRLVPSITALDAQLAAAITARLNRWLDARISTVLTPLFEIDAMARSPETPASYRAVLAAMVNGGGVVARVDVMDVLSSLTGADRLPLYQVGVHIGILDLYIVELLKPLPQRWRAALAAAWDGTPPALPPVEGVTLIDAGAAPPGSVNASDFRSVGDRRFRIDMVDKVGKHAHAARRAAVIAAQTAADEEAASAEAAANTEGAEAAANTEGAAVDIGADTVADDASPPPRAPRVASRNRTTEFHIDPIFATSLGLQQDERLSLIRSLGFRSTYVPKIDAPPPKRLRGAAGLVQRAARASAALEAAAAAAAAAASAPVPADDNGLTDAANGSSPATPDKRRAMVPDEPQILWRWRGVKTPQSFGAEPRFDRKAGGFVRTDGLDLRRKKLASQTERLSASYGRTSPKPAGGTQSDRAPQPAAAPDPANSPFAVLASLFDPPKDR